MDACDVLIGGAGPPGQDTRPVLRSFTTSGASRGADTS